MAVTRQVRARLDVISDHRDDARHVSAFKAVDTDKCNDAVSVMGDGELAWQVGDDAWIFNNGASTHIRPSADQMKNTEN